METQNTNRPEPKPKTDDSSKPAAGTSLLFEKQTGQVEDLKTIVRKNENGMITSVQAMPIADRGVLTITTVLFDGKISVSTAFIAGGRIVQPQKGVFVLWDESGILGEVE